MGRRKILRIKENRPSLIADFNAWLVEAEKEEAYESWNSWGNWDDDYGDIAGAYGNLFGAFGEEDEGVLLGKRASKKQKDKVTKRGKRGGKKKQKEEEISPSLSDEELDDILHQKRSIYFYDNIEDEKSVHKFGTLQKFFNFLDDSDIYISDNEAAKFIREDVRHCCIDPMALAVRGQKEITSDHSYGALAYEVSEDAALFDC